MVCISFVCNNCFNIFYDVFELVLSHIIFIKIINEKGNGMRNKLSKKLNDWFDGFASKATYFLGSSAAFSVAFFIIMTWIISGPLFKFSDTWQLVINTSTTIVTFLMVFLIQRSQNKESLATQLKLNELVASSKDASNRLIDVEDLTQEELELLHNFYIKLARRSKKESNIQETHSIEDEEEALKRDKQVKKSK